MDVRVIAGQNRGRKLKSVQGMKTRPTADRVKEAVFSSVEGLLFGSRFLDVFSGTGSIALEAVSRGAAEAVLLEKDRDALQVIAFVNNFIQFLRIHNNLICLHKSPFTAFNGTFQLI